jgi:hypothetical protein
MRLAAPSVDPTLVQPSTAVTSAAFTPMDSHFANDGVPVDIKARHHGAQQAGSNFVCRS